MLTSQTHRHREQARIASKHGFTLVELLVVIGIIAVLISILLPSLSKVRESGERTRCAANLRSLAQLLRVYANTNGDRVPLGYINGVKQASYHIYTEGRAPNTLGAYPLWGRLYQAKLVGNVWPGTGDFSGYREGIGKRLLGCSTEQLDAWAASSVENAWPPGSASDSSRSSYSMRPVINWLIVPGTDGYNPVEPMPKLSSFRKRTAIMSDLMVYENMPRTRHGDGINVAFADSSVRYVQWKQVGQYMTNVRTLAAVYNPLVDQFWSELDRQ